MAAASSDSTHSHSGSDKELEEVTQSKITYHPRSPPRHLLEIPDLSAAEWEVAAFGKLFTGMSFSLTEIQDQLHGRWQFKERLR